MLGRPKGASSEHPEAHPLQIGAGGNQSRLLGSGSDVSSLLLLCHPLEGIKNIGPEGIKGLGPEGNASGVASP